MSDWTATGGGGDINAHRAHAAHAIVLTLHTLCCGLPVAVAALGATAGALAWGGMFLTFHDWLHHYEGLILAGSAGLVVVGAIFEWRARQNGGRGFPLMLAFSAACFLVNAAIVVMHQAPLEAITQASGAIMVAQHDHAH